ncbi:shikimate dehydrogenase [Microbacterium sp. Marseille-Q6965]|uniref:shikimate dehydrogenase n=1 Tax=Microbacterium sp. Marseille-Q6965 TaxID=2965072 RepID=UPI0021B7FCDA|nr:shikimate dehydrogenase [Microbacterium sp. Marseille-Q6965]
MTTERPTPLRVGLIGAGIQRSLSPLLHEAEAREQGFSLRYELFDVDVLRQKDPARLIAAARDLGYAGLNITHPLKQRVVPLMDALSDQAAAIGAVNTVVFEPDGRTVGHNTDVSGFAGMISRGVGDVRGHRVLQLGAGGAGSAVAHALLAMGVSRLEIRDLDAARAERLAASLVGREVEVVGAGLDGAAQALAGADGLINATFVGMVGHPGTPVPLDAVRASHWVADIVYFPARTELLQGAEERGARIVGGADMTAIQAADAFRLITGREPDTERMLAHIARLVRDRLADERAGTAV